MNLLLTLTSIIIFIFSLLPVQVFAAENIYYVTQNGSGTRNGRSLGNALSASDFNALRGSGYAGDTFYFSGTFSTRIRSRVSGTSGGGNVILDGYQSGNCDSINSECSSSADLRNGMDIQNQSYVTVQDFRMTKNNDTYPCLYTNLNDHILIQRNYIRQVDWSYFQARATSYIIIRGNKFVHFGQHNTDPAQGFNFIEVEHYLVSGNEIGHDESSYPSGCRSANTMEMHGTHYGILEYNDIYGAPNQAGISYKESYGGGTNNILRFNKFHDNNENGSGMGGDSRSPWTHNYIYGNFYYSNGYKPIETEINNDYIYIWSNIFTGGGNRGWSGSTWAGNPTPKHIYLYNNTWAFNGEDNSDYDTTAISAKYCDNCVAKNNILYKNNLSGTSGRYHQVQSLKGNMTFDYNDYYHPNANYSSVAIAYYSGYKTWSQFQTAGQESHGKIWGSDIFTDANGANSIGGDSDDDYTLTENTTVGEDLSQAFYVNLSGGDSWFETNTGYSTITMNLNIALSPDTVWVGNATTLSSNVKTAVRGSDGIAWDRGAYVYVGESGSQQAQQITKPKGLRIISN